MQRAIPLILVAVGILTVVLIGTVRSKRTWPKPVALLEESYARKPVKTADHSKLPALQRTFATPQEVTEACLSCHTERGREVMASSHWNWEREEYIPGRGIRAIGKKDILNNFCIGVATNLETCDKCHAGYGYTGANFDFTDPRNIDCLVCHDNSATYARTGMGLPDPLVDLAHVAQHVGRPTRDNCGYCHFYGGGGNNVKHGDLEEALFAPDRELDVHMDIAGSDMACVDCHRTQNHRILGKLYSVSSMNRNRSTCEQCHGELPHEDGLLNEHTLKVACQTCHIPTYARANATKVAWDWSTAGRLRDGEPFEETDSLGRPLYMSIKGSFVWAQDTHPEYIWFNGTAGHYLAGDTVSDAVPIALNTLRGRYEDPDARIIPVKVHRARQLYDPVTRMIIQPKLYAPAPGAEAYWKDFDWNRAAEAGMRECGLDYSGRYTFAATEMTWPINHMVAPKEGALTCSECHSREGSRLAGLRGFYMPGRDRSERLDWIGTIAVAVSIASVISHAGLRMIVRRRRGRAS